MSQPQIGIIGLATMGANLARNFANKGVKTVVFNRTYERTQEFLQQYGNSKALLGKNLIGAKTLKEFVKALTSPRTIILMVKAGDPVDAVLQQLTPLLKKGDSIMDFGNSDYPDTERRAKEMAKKGLHFWGCGISGGEEGALHGPSLMPGGEKSQWPRIEKLLSKVAARDFRNAPCVTLVGPGGAGHFIKTVHNGIEYAIMQSIAETYDFMARALHLSAPEIAEQLKHWNRGPLKSFLLETAIKVLLKKDDYKNEGTFRMGNLQGSRDFSVRAVLKNTVRKKSPDNEAKTHPESSAYLIDKVLDKAGMKGTGIWTVREALEHGAPAPGIAQAVFARSISHQKELRTKLEKLFSDGPGGRAFKSSAARLSPAQKKSTLSLLEQTFHASVLISFAQGFDLIMQTSKAHSWNINLAEVARIWQGGCIIRINLLKSMEQELRALGKNSTLEKHTALKNSTHTTTRSAAPNSTPAHLLALPAVTKQLKASLPATKKIVSLAIEKSIPMPTTTASLNYLLAITQARGNAHIIQGLRDAFGAHTYERTDRDGTFHTQW